MKILARALPVSKNDDFEQRKNEKFDEKIPLKINNFIALMAHLSSLDFFGHQESF